MIDYILLMIELSWPVLIFAYGVSWLVLRRRRPLGVAGMLFFVLSSLVLFLAVAFSLTIAWLPQFGTPRLYPYVYGPALVAAVLVFPCMWWWFGKRKAG